jgi:hypothetical protein
MLALGLLQRLDQCAKEHAIEIAPDANPWEFQKICDQLLVQGVLIALWEDAQEYFGSETKH